MLSTAISGIVGIRAAGEPLVVSAAGPVGAGAAAGAGGGGAAALAGVDGAAELVGLGLAELAGVVGLGEARLSEEPGTVEANEPSQDACLMYFDGLKVLGRIFTSGSALVFGAGNNASSRHADGGDGAELFVAVGT